MRIRPHRLHTCRHKGKYFNLIIYVKPDGSILGCKGYTISNTLTAYLQSSLRHHQNYTELLRWGWIFTYFILLKCLLMPKRLLLFSFYTVILSIQRWDGGELNQILFSINHPYTLHYLNNSEIQNSNFVIYNPIKILMSCNKIAYSKYHLY